jgi:hypothetical protein
MRRFVIATVIIGAIVVAAWVATQTPGGATSIDQLIAQIRAW